MKRAILLVVISLSATQVFAQTIADFARRERERRAAAAEGAKPTEVTNSTNSTNTTGPAKAPEAGTRAPEAAAPVGVGRARTITLTTSRATLPADIGGESDDVFTYYDIRAGSAADIRGEIARLGPFAGGSRQQAVTNASTTWKPDTSPVAGGKCAVTAINLTVKIEILMPRWLNEVGAPQSLSESWRKFLTGLLNHEHGHKEIALAGAEEIRKLAKNATPSATCQSAANAFNAAAKAVMERTAVRQSAYDKETDHGRLQGVRLP